MSYSQTRHYNAPYEFPPPPMFAVWVQDSRWDRATRTHTDDNRGQIRHVADLAKAKKRVSDYTLGGRNETVFRTSWAIYEWNTDKGEYVLQFEGVKGQPKNLNALFQLKVKKGETVERPGFEEEEAAALASIMEAVRS